MVVNLKISKLNHEIKLASSTLLSTHHLGKSSNKKIKKLTIPKQRISDIMKNETDSKRRQIKVAALFREAIMLDPKIKNKNKKIASIFYCGAFRHYYLDTTKTHKRLREAIFCNERLCPNCGRRKAYKARIKLQTIFNYLNHHYQYKNGNPKYLPIFATFTVPNIKDNAHDFKHTYKKLHHRFSLMLSFKKFCGFFKRGKEHLDGVIQGGVSKVEITYNVDSDTFHLHIHSLLLVHRSYFTGRYYIPFKEWRSAWERAWGWNYKKTGKHLEINIQRPWYKDPKTGKRCRVINANNAREADKRAITEVTGYGTKADDFLRMLDPHDNKKTNLLNFKQCQKAFISAYFGTKNQKTYTYFGLIGKLSKLYNQGKLDDYKPKDNHIYAYNMDATYKEKTKKYSLKTTKMTREEMKEAEAQGLKTPLSHSEPHILKPTSKHNFAYDRLDYLNRHPENRKKTPKDEYIKLYLEATSNDTPHNRQ